MSFLHLELILKQPVKYKKMKIYTLDLVRTLILPQNKINPSKTILTYMNHHKKDTFEALFRF